MKHRLISLILLATTLIVTSAFSATSSNTNLLFAAKKYKTVRHTVTHDNCQQTRKKIYNRCLYKHKMSKSFCAKQDRKNAAICADLAKKAAEYRKSAQQKAATLKASENRYNACLKASDCDKPSNDEAATKWCYEHCQHHAKPGN